MYKIATSPILVQKLEGHVRRRPTPEAKRLFLQVMASNGLSEQIRETIFKNYILPTYPSHCLFLACQFSLTLDDEKRAQVFDRIADLSDEELPEEFVDEVDDTVKSFLIAHLINKGSPGNIFCAARFCKKVYFSTVIKLIETVKMSDEKLLRRLLDAEWFNDTEDIEKASEGVQNLFGKFSNEAKEKIKPLIARQIATKLRRSPPPLAIRKRAHLQALHQKK